MSFMYRQRMPGSNELGDQVEYIDGQVVSYGHLCNSRLFREYRELFCLFAVEFYWATVLVLRLD